jgi:hypothetical protein
MGKYFEDSVTDMKHFADKKRDLSSMREHTIAQRINQTRRQGILGLPRFWNILDLFLIS